MLIGQRNDQTQAYGNQRTIQILMQILLIVRLNKKTSY